jgi:hypothetical protein
MSLRQVPGRIEADRGPLLHGFVCQHPMWHIAMPGAGAIHSISVGRMAHPR